MRLFGQKARLEYLSDLILNDEENVPLFRSQEREHAKLVNQQCIAINKLGIAYNKKTFDDGILMRFIKSVVASIQYLYEFGVALDLLETRMKNSLIAYINEINCGAVIVPYPEIEKDRCLRMIAYDFPSFFERHLNNFAILLFAFLTATGLGALLHLGFLGPVGDLLLETPVGNFLVWLGTKTFFVALS